MKLAYVLPMYGAEVLGGAEGAARALAEHLVERPGWSVEVLTTCARESTTWADAFPAGTTVEGGVTVRRMHAQPRSADFDDWSARVLRSPEHADPELEREWIARQGPTSPELIEAVAASDADLVAFHPYLYHPTVAGLPRVARRSLLHAAAHDEAPIRLPVFRRVFGSARGLVFWTTGEQRFVNRTFAVRATPQLVLGIGVEGQSGDPAAARAAVGLGDRPYLLCLGRVDDGKGTGMLAAFFAAYKERHPGPLALVFAGPVKNPPAPHPDIVVAGAVDEPTKWGLLRGAQMLVNPSAMESFSIVVLEAWEAGVPVLVNARCHATHDHAAQSDGGLWFDGYGEFEVAVERMTGDADLRAALTARGRAYVAARYHWPTLLDRYTAFCARLAPA